MGNRLSVHVVINAAEKFARIRDAFWCGFLNDTGGEGESVRGRFEKAVELRERELALLRNAEEQACPFPNDDVTFALTPAARRRTVSGDRSSDRANGRAPRRPSGRGALA